MGFSPRHGANKPNKQIKTAKGICLQVSAAGIPPKLGQGCFASFKAWHELAAGCERKQSLRRNVDILILKCWYKLCV